MVFSTQAIKESPARAIVFWPWPLPAVKIPKEQLHLIGSNHWLVEYLPAGSIPKSQLSDQLLWNGTTHWQNFVDVHTEYDQFYDASVLWANYNTRVGELDILE